MLYIWLFPGGPSGPAHPGASRLPRSLGWVLIILLAAPAAPAVDFGSWARQLRQHERWTSVEFRDPTSGKFLASRAGTEDVSAGATLTLTADPADGCLPEIVVVFKLDVAAVRDLDQPGNVELRIDRRRKESIQVHIVQEKGDSFLFFQIVDPFDPDRLAGHRTLQLTMLNTLLAEFSLRGFPDAWRTARSVCVNFLPVY